MPQTFSHNSLFSRKYDLIRLIPYHIDSAILQHHKRQILQNFSQTKKRDYQQVALSSLTNSENLAISIGTNRPRRPVLIYSMIVLDFKFYIIYKLKHHQN